MAMWGRRKRQLSDVARAAKADVAKGSDGGVGCFRNRYRFAIHGSTVALPYVLYGNYCILYRTLNNICFLRMSHIGQLPLSATILAVHRYVDELLRNWVFTGTK